MNAEGVRAGGEAIDESLESRHPAGGEVAVLEQHPVPRRDARVHHLLCDGALALAERRRLQPVAKALRARKLEQRAERVGARGEYEDQGRARRRVRKRGAQVERLALGEALAERHAHHVLHRAQQDLGAEQFRQEQSRKGRRHAGALVNALGPVAGQRAQPGLRLPLPDSPRELARDLVLERAERADETPKIGRQARLEVVGQLPLS